MSNNKLNQDAENLEKTLDDRQEPDSVAEATTAALDDEALGGHATEADRPNKTDRPKNK